MCARTDKPAHRMVLDTSSLNASPKMPHREQHFWLQVSVGVLSDPPYAEILSVGDAVHC